MKRQLKKFIPSALLLFSLLLPSPALAAAQKKEPVDTQELILANENTPLDENYKNIALIDIAPSVLSTKQSILINKTAAKYYREMVKDMEKEGLSLYLVSGYRSFSYQTGLFEEELENQIKIFDNQYEKAYAAAKSVVALPGRSEHQTGFTVDVSTEDSLTEAFADTEPGKWLAENSWQYGFILRYPKEKQSITNIIYEPWHFRYVGQPHAEYMTKNNLCLEEYIALLKQEKTLTFLSSKGVTYTINYSNEIPEDAANADSFSSTNEGGYVTVFADGTAAQPIEKTEDYFAQISSSDYVEEIKAVIPNPSSVIYPKDGITKAFFLSLLPLEEKEDVQTASSFTDLGVNHTYYQAIKSAYEKGLIQAKDGLISPNSFLTREEAVQIVSAMIENKRVTYIDYIDLTDISASAFQDFQKLAALNLLSADSENRIRPQEQITTEEACHLIYQLKEFLATSNASNTP